MGAHHQLQRGELVALPASSSRSIASSIDADRLRRRCGADDEAIVRRQRLLLDRHRLLRVEPWCAPRRGGSRRCGAGAARPGARHPRRPRPARDARRVSGRCGRTRGAPRRGSSVGWDRSPSFTSQPAVRTLSSASWVSARSLASTTDVRSARTRSARIRSASIWPYSGCASSTHRAVGSWRTARDPRRATPRRSRAAPHTVDAMIDRHRARRREQLRARARRLERAGRCASAATPRARGRRGGRPATRVHRRRP